MPQPADRARAAADGIALCICPFLLPYACAPAREARVLRAPLPGLCRTSGSTVGFGSLTVGELGTAALDSPHPVEGIAARRAFWRTANAALARFADGIDASRLEAIRAALEAATPTAIELSARRMAIQGD